MGKNKNVRVNLYIQHPVPGWVVWGAEFVYGQHQKIFSEAIIGEINHGYVIQRMLSRFSEPLKIELHCSLELTANVKAEIESTVWMHVINWHLLPEMNLPIEVSRRIEIEIVHAKEIHKIGFIKNLSVFKTNEKYLIFEGSKGECSLFLLPQGKKSEVVEEQVSLF